MLASLYPAKRLSGRFTFFRLEVPAAVAAAVAATEAVGQGCADDDACFCVGFCCHDLTEERKTKRRAVGDSSRTDIGGGGEGALNYGMRGV